MANGRQRTVDNHDADKLLFDELQHALDVCDFSPDEKKVRDSGVGVKQSLQLSSFPKFLAVGNLLDNLLVEKISSKNAQFGAENLQVDENF